MTAEAKRVVRRQLLAARRIRPDSGAADAERSGHLLALPEVAAARTVAAYASLPGEPSTVALLDALLARVVTVLLPAVRPDRVLAFRTYDGRLVPGLLGTVEPPPGRPELPLTSADVVLVPALAVDSLGRRLGRGGGSYDRALAALAPSVLVVALLNEDELLGEVPVEAHDRPVGAAALPGGVVRLPPR